MTQGDGCGQTYAKFMTQSDGNVAEGEDGVLAHQAVVLGLVLCVQPSQSKLKLTCYALFHSFCSTMKLK